MRFLICSIFAQCLAFFGCASHPKKSGLGPNVLLSDPNQWQVEKLRNSHVEFLCPR